MNVYVYLFIEQLLYMYKFNETSVGTGVGNGSMQGIWHPNYLWRGY